jgi:hypothetical protein
MKQIDRLYIVLLFCILLNIGLWLYSHDIRSQWGNVPPVPDEKHISSMALGDKELAYRMTGLTLQNLGDTGGRSTSLKEYDYNKLSKWFFLLDKMDPHSDYVPFLAAYYFGATPNGEQIPPIVDFLEYAGNRAEGEKWRWLAYAVYLARFQMDDINKAIIISNKLARLQSETYMPAWTRQMPAFLQTKIGNKEAAYEIMMNILQSEIDHLDPGEVIFTQNYICNNLLSEFEARTHPLCKNLSH